jgi:hypothetical protein
MPMRQNNEAKKPNDVDSGGILRRLFGRGEGDKAAHVAPSAQSALNLKDIQGLILRGYRMPMVRHFLLKVNVPAVARKLLGRLVSGDEIDAPQITTAQDWHVGIEPGLGDNLADAPRCKPDYCLNIGITWPGLLALGVKDRAPDLSFKSFGAFVSGAAARAELVGDTGPNEPKNWIGGFGTGSDDVLVTLHASSQEARAAYSGRLMRTTWLRDLTLVF